MAQTGNFSPIQLYSSSTPGNAPAVGNLVNSTLGSELAINIADGKLFYKDSANAIQVIAWKTTPTTAGGTGLTSYTAGDMVYWASGTTFTKLGIGAANYIMTSSGSAPQWSASIGPAQGGTGITSYAVGDLIYASGTTTLSKLADVATGNALISGGVTTAPSWGKIGLTTHVSGTLPVGNGGTGLTTLTAGYIPYGNGTSAFSSSSNLYFDGTNLGIGGAASGAKVEVTGSGTVNLKVTSTSGNAQLILKSSGTNDGYINYGQGGAGGLVFYDSNASSERVRIDSGGALRINATGIVYATGEYLSVATGTGGVGAAFAGTNTSYTLGVWNKGTSSPGFVQFAQGASGLPCGSISFNGTLTVYATTSDKRLKTDIGVSTDTSVIDNTIIHDFTWNNGVVDKGVFAQEAHRIKPSAVQVGNDELSKNGDLLKPWGVDYSAYVPDLIVKCQQQDKIINDLLKRITALENK